MEENKDIVQFIQAKKTEVPSGEYFENLANIILEKHVAPTVKVIPFYKKPVFKWMAAAAAIGPFILYFALQDSSQNQNDVLAGMNELSKNDIHAYMMENQERFHIDEVVEMTDLKTIERFSLESTSFNTTENSSIFNEISKDEIESYLEYYYGDANSALEELENEKFI